MLAVDFKGHGVESEHRAFGATKDGYNDGGEPFVHSTFRSFGGNSYHHQYPHQMFDRKLRPMDTLFVGLVCTKRPMGIVERRRLVRQTPDLKFLYDTYMAANAAGNPSEDDGVRDAIPVTVQSFYTFHFVCFSSNQAWLTQNGAVLNGYENNSKLQSGNFNGFNTDAVHRLGYAEPSAKKARKHYEEASTGETYDPYVGPSRREFAGMVGAWKIGTVMDISAKKRDQYTGGPIDTTTAVAVNVNVEFKDWRQLRRDFDRPDIGMIAPGARPWIDEASLEAVRRANPTLTAQQVQQQALGQTTLTRVNPLPSRADLEAEQSRDGTGKVPPALNSAARVKYDEWLETLFLSDRKLGFMRLDPAAHGGDMNLPDPKSPTGQTYFQNEITRLRDAMHGAHDDDRTFRWPTAYIPLLSIELRGITQQQLDVKLGTLPVEALEEAFVAHPARDAGTVAAPAPAGTREARDPRNAATNMPAPTEIKFQTRDNLRYKLIHNMPLDLTCIESMNDLLGDQPLAVPFVAGRDDRRRKRTATAVDGLVRPSRQLKLRQDALRRDGLSYGPANRMIANPLARDELQPGATGTPPFYADHPMNSAGSVALLWGSPGDAQFDSLYGHLRPDELRQVYETARNWLLQSGRFVDGGPLSHPGFFDRQTMNDMQELFDLYNPVSVQWKFYQSNLQQSRDLRQAGFGLGFRGRVFYARRGFYGLFGNTTYSYDYLDSITGTFSTRATIDAVWNNLVAFAGGATNISLVQWIGWLAGQPAAFNGDPASIAGQQLPAGMLVARSQAPLVRGTPAAARVNPDATLLAAVGGDPFKPAAELRQNVARLIGAPPGGAVPPPQRAFVEYVVDWQLMSMLDNGPGISKDDFIDYYAPRTPEEQIAQSLSRKQFGPAYDGRLVELINTPIMPDSLQSAALVHLVQMSGSDSPTPSAGGSGTGGGAGPSGSVADVVMADAAVAPSSSSSARPAATAATASGSSGKAVAKPPVRKRSAPPVQPVPAPTLST
ncbi:MAG: hypothetical protein ACKVI4_15710, partial [Actinomycetales bacterium]